MTTQQFVEGLKVEDLEIRELLKLRDCLFPIRYLTKELTRLYLEVTDKLETKVKGKLVVMSN